MFPGPGLHHGSLAGAEVRRAMTYASGVTT
jgi:hypothetical protein